MTKMRSNENAGGLHSENGPQQGDLRDERQGTYDPVGNQKLPDTNQQTEHERAQPGADVQTGAAYRRYHGICSGQIRHQRMACATDRGRTGGGFSHPGSIS
jgi:hypothetical protein